MLIILTRSFDMPNLFADYLARDTFSVTDTDTETFAVTVTTVATHVECA